MTNNYFKVKGGLEVPDADDFWIGETLTPSIRPSLLLDFAKTKQLDGRVVFARNSTGTYYDGKTTAKAEENLTVYSQEFNQWNKINLTVTADATTAPDGTTTADLITGAGTGAPQIYQTPVSGGQRTFSFYAKAGTNNFVQILHSGDATSYANYNISTGVLGTVGAGSTATITSVGNGWYRCTETTSTTGTNFVIQLVTSATAARSETNTLTTTVYLWGSQLEERSSVTPYIATGATKISTSIPVLKTAPVNAPRFNHDPVTGESLGLLIEPESTNLLLYSSDLTQTSWSKIRCSISSNVMIAPDGTLTGDKIVETTDLGAHMASQIVSTTNTSPLTYSAYVKAAERTKVSVVVRESPTYTRSISFTLNLTTGAVSNLSSAGGATTPVVSVVSVGNGWWRFSVATTLGGTDTQAQVYVCGNIDVSGTWYTGDGVSGFYQWGSQLEQLGTATSYVPTTSSTATRQADDCTVTLGSWYNQNEGTIFAHAKTNITDNNRVVVNAQSGTYNRIGLSTCQAIGYNLAYIGNNYVTQLTKSFGSASTEYRKVALAYAHDNSNTALDGSVSTEDTQCTIPTVSGFRIGGISTINSVLNGHIKKIAYYPKRLSNQELVDMTE